MHLKNIFNVSSHSVIYNRDYAYYFIKRYENGIKIPNDMLWNDFNIIKYSYYKPLCFQIAMETENSANWIFSSVIIKVNKLFNLHKKHQPGFTIYNIISLIISFHLIYLFLNYKFLLFNIK